MIKIENLSKVYGEKELQVIALKDINLEIQPGEFTAIVGPSGSGKTSLLNCIGGLDTPTTGKVFIKETDLSRLSENELIDFRLHNIGFVFQSYNLIPVLSAYENVEFLMLLQGEAESKRLERSLHLLDAVGLKDLSHKRPTHMSGGQQQRVAVARALASNPSFVLADEPTANLDAQSTSNLLDVMLKMNLEEQVTFVFSTHDQRVIDRARRIITIEDGKVAEDYLVKRE